MNSTSQMGLMKTYFHNSLFKAAYMNKILAISPHFAHMYLLYALFVWHFNEYTIKLYFILYSIAEYPHQESIYRYARWDCWMYSYSERTIKIKSNNVRNWSNIYYNKRELEVLTCHTLYDFVANWLRRNLNYVLRLVLSRFFS